MDARVGECAFFSPGTGKKSVFFDNCRTDASILHVLASGSSYREGVFSCIGSMIYTWALARVIDWVLGWLGDCMCGAGGDGVTAG